MQLAVLIQFEASESQGGTIQRSWVGEATVKFGSHVPAKVNSLMSRGRVEIGLLIGTASMLSELNPRDQFSSWLLGLERQPGRLRYTKPEW